MLFWIVVLFDLTVTVPLFVVLGGHRLELDDKLEVDHTDELLEAKHIFELSAAVGHNPHMIVDTNFVVHPMIAKYDENVVRHSEADDCDCQYVEPRDTELFVSLHAYHVVRDVPSQ